jgi:hypothetical protein
MKVTVEVLLQAAQLADVLTVAAGVHDGAGAEKHAGLEEGVGEDVEEARGEGPHAAADKHEAELRHGGVREHLLQLGLRDQRDARPRRAR